MQRKTSMGIVLLLSAAIPIIVVAYSTGPPAAHTGAPFPPDNGKTCTVCHSGTVNSGSGSVRITTFPATYDSGGTFPITVTVSDPQARRWGFELSARTQGGQQAGTLILGSDGFTQFTSEGGIQYIEHTLAGTRGGTANGVPFSFQWRAPDVSTGPVTFYVAGNAANNNFSDSGDRIYTRSETVQPQAAPPGPTPSISEGGVVSAASFAPAPAPLAPGTIAAVFGTNLTDGTSCLPPTCSPSLEGGKLKTTMAGAQVTINGTPVPIFFATPTLLAIQIPTELTTPGPATIQVTVGSQTSAARSFPMDTAAPGIFTTAASGAGQGAILNGLEIAQGVSSLVAPAGSFPNAHPARPGDVVVIFGTGLGPVTPPLATGVLPSSHTTLSTPTVTMDGLAAEVLFSGLTPGNAGLNQINVRVPAAARPANNVAVVVTMNGKPSNPVTIAVGSPAPPPSSNPVPTITSLSPALLEAGAAAQTLTINGTGFLSASTATWGGSPKTVAFVGETRLTLPLAASDLAQAGGYAVAVTNPPPGGGTSSVFNFTVQPPLPPRPSDDYY